MKGIFALFQGTDEQSAGVPPDKKVQPASPAVRYRLMSLLKRSLLAASSFPANLQVCLRLIVWPALYLGRD